MTSEISGPHAAAYITIARAEVELYYLIKRGARLGGGGSTLLPGRFTPGKETQFPL